MAVDNQNPQLNINTTAKEVKKAKRFRLILILLVLLLIPLAIWGTVTMLVEENVYKIRVNGNFATTLSLSFEKEFLGGGFSVLKGQRPESTTSGEGTGYSEGISDYVNQVKNGEIKMVISDDGQSGKPFESTGNDEFVASKFYLRNNEPAGTNPVNYVIRINVLENSKNALSAARFYLISDCDSNPTHQMFAQPKADGSAEYVATKHKGGDTYVSSPTGEDNWLCTNLVVGEDGWYYESAPVQLDAGEVVGFTFAVWYEGSDPDHTNAIIGGYIAFELEFTVVD